MQNLLALGTLTLIKVVCKTQSYKQTLHLFCKIDLVSITKKLRDFYYYWLRYQHTMVVFSGCKTDFARSNAVPARRLSYVHLRPDGLLLEDGATGENKLSRDPSDAPSSLQESSWDSDSTPAPGVPCHASDCSGSVGQWELSETSTYRAQGVPQDIARLTET